MSSLKTNETDFQQALLAPELPPPEGITAWNGMADARRFDVYRNNVIVSLIDALANSFDVVQQLVGEAFFRAMAREFLRDPANLPDSPVLAHYGGHFPAFIDQFEPAASLPFLGAVARLEWLRLQSLHAADAAPVDNTALMDWVEGKANHPNARLVLHPSLLTFSSRYAAVSIWAAHQGLKKLADVDPTQAEHALILRPALEVELIPLAAADLALVDQLSAGAPLQALRRDQTQAAALDRVLAILAHHGAITGLIPA